MRSGRRASSVADVADRLRELRQDLLLEQLAPRVERLAHDVAAGEDHDVEDVVDDRRRRRAVVLQRVERRPPVLVERDDLAVDHRLIRQLGERLQRRPDTAR